MDDKKIDLNLMRVFQALIQDGNLTRAGYRLDLSQPAMSHALSKLRKLMGDELFIRIPSGMQPTEIALRIAPDIQRGLQLIEAALAGKSNFDPSACNRTFQILMSDIGEIAYLPRLLLRLSELAPKANLRIIQLPRESYHEAFVNGDSDLAIGFLPSLQAGFYQQRLFTDSYVCLVRDGHPRLKDSLSIEEFEAEAHILIEAGGSRYKSSSLQSSTTTLIEQHISELGIMRRVALRVPHFIVVPDIVNSTDYVATVPSYVVKHMVPRPSLRMLQLPFEVPKFEIKLFWHERGHNDPGNRWLRGVLSELFMEKYPFS